MPASRAVSRRRLLVPEVVQASAMDCGPASLKCLLEGFGIPVSYGRLREACQTDVDGSSIDVLGEVAVQLGLDAEQVMIPPDHLLLTEAQALPALLVVQIASGVTHFVVVWRVHGRFVQLMDPATGRRWVTKQQLFDELYHHSLTVPAEAWEAWARSNDFLLPLHKRLADLGVPRSKCELLVAQALSTNSWHSLATLDAAARMIAGVVRSGGLRRGHEATQALLRLSAWPHDAPSADWLPDSIPPAYWSVRPAPSNEDGAQLYLRGAVLLRVRGLRATSDASDAPELTPELAAALAEPPGRLARELLRLLRADGIFAPTLLLLALLLAAAGTVLEALLLNSLLTLSAVLSLPLQRAGALATLLVFLAVMLLLELASAAGLLRAGRALELRLRLAFCAKLPRLSDRYFQSRLTSDMAERAHVIHLVRSLPELGGQIVKNSIQIGLVAIGISWLNPACAPFAALAAVLAIIIPLAGIPALSEYDLRVRTYAGALGRFVLDALLGLVVIRTHSAERAVRREQERLLIEWVRAGYRFFRRLVLIEGIQSLTGTALAIAIMVTHLQTTMSIGSGLLLAYWTLRLPHLAQELGRLARVYPYYRNIIVRLLEPLGALEEEAATSASGTPTACQGGVAIAFHDVQVQAAGQTILEDLTLEIAPGSHIAIVGPSGAGKSSLVGLLLGWHRPASGEICVDGEPLTGPALARLRHSSAWIDPAVQLWNRTLLDNLVYGLAPDELVPPDAALTHADLQRMLEQLPEGLQTQIGEGGGLLSGGEGQRIRLARALLRPHVRLAILDEPFRGLSREQRHHLLPLVRQHWQNATFICVTHDISETLQFERVLVIENGRIIEDDLPTRLMARPGSRYRELIEAETEAHRRLWGEAGWRRIHMQQRHTSIDARSEEHQDGYAAGLGADLADQSTRHST